MQFSDNTDSNQVEFHDILVKFYILGSVIDLIMYYGHSKVAELKIELKKLHLSSVGNSCSSILFAKIGTVQHCGILESSISLVRLIKKMFKNK